MSRLGILCFPGTGHLNPLTSLGRRLQQQGHEVTVFQIADVEPVIRAAGLDFIRIGHREFPIGTLRSLDEKLSRLGGLAAMRYTAERVRANSAMILNDAPNAVREAGIDALIVDQAEPAGGTVAQHLDLPFVSAAAAMPAHLEPNVPFFAYNWRYGNSLVHRTRNQLGNLFIEKLANPVRTVINRYRDRWHLPAIHRTNEFYSTRAQISQIPSQFDFPDRELPSCFHYTGPFIDSAGRTTIDFPWERVSNDRPLVYASMGTLQNGIGSVFQTIAEACSGLGVQLVISLGGGMRSEEVGPMAGNPIVVRYAPQLDLIRQSCLVINHGGLNTVLEALAHGVPMVAIPVTNDQPGVAARIKWTGSGETIPLQRLTVSKLRRAVHNVLENPSYRIAARSLRDCISGLNGLEQASDIVERALGGQDYPSSSSLSLSSSIP
jgi:zeaxanthin glucosyltransferase